MTGSFERIRVSSRALGPRRYVEVHVYDTLAEMRAAAEAGNGNDHHDSLGVTQAWVDRQGRVVRVVVRLARGHLGTRVVTHEMHHAATAIYGAHVGRRIFAATHLTHYNEGFAHLYSDLTHMLVDRLYTLGYYG